MPNRKKQIAAKINASNNSQSAFLYTPSTVQLLNTPVNYNGEMIRIRVCAFIYSLPEVYVPIILPTDTNLQKEQKNEMFRKNPKKGLMIYLQNPSKTEKYEIGLIDLYNVKPYFQTGISEFFSDLDSYGIEFGWSIVAEMVDRGHGLLQTNTGENQEDYTQDYISITGWVKEDSSFLQGNNDAIYNFIGNN